MKKIVLRLTICLLLLNFSIDLMAQTIDLDQVKAQEDFRWGVRAFNNGYFNEAIIYFERAMAFNPEDPLFHYWLGRSYYQSGYEEAANSEWQSLIDNNQATATLVNFIDIINQRRGIFRDVASSGRYVVMSDLLGQEQDNLRFLRPTSVKTDSVGGYYLSSYVTNQILHVNVNGAIKGIFDGGLVGFDRPFDVQVVEDGFYVSEYNGDKISFCDLNGYRQFSFGDQGEGSLLGPQYMAMSGDGFIYVSDWGHRRVVKYTEAGDFVLSFGSEIGGFPGLMGPSGITVQDDIVYVADSIHGCIYGFDPSGNYLLTLVKDRSFHPEGLVSFKEHDLLFSDGSLIYRVDTNNDTVTIFCDLTDEADRLMGLDIDANNNIVVPDFDSNRVVVLGDITGMYSGFFVRINRVNSDAFPDVYLDVTIEDREGNPVVGLDTNNFYITENYNPVGEFDLAYSGYLSTTTEVTVLVPRTFSTQTHSSEYQTVLNKLQSSFNRFSLVSVGQTADLEIDENESVQGFMNNLAGDNEWEEQVPLDTGIRRASAEMIPGRENRSIVCLYSDISSPLDFNGYGLVETARYMANNGITFSVVYFNQEFNNELEYLVKETGGVSLFYGSSSGLSPLFDHLEDLSSGNYTLHYQSSSDSEFGKAFIDVSVESFIVSRSGRDELGFFTPLQF